MTTLTLGTGPDRPAFARLDITPVEGGFIEGGDLGETGGNLYLYLDGQEWGSLFIHYIDGTPQITLGQHAPDTDDCEGEWCERNPLTHPVVPEELTARPTCTIAVVRRRAGQEGKVEPCGRLADHYVSTAGSEAVFTDPGDAHPVCARHGCETTPASDERGTWGYLDRA